MTNAIQVKKNLQIIKKPIFKKVVISTFILNLCIGSSFNTRAVDAQNIQALNQGEVRLIQVGESYRFVDSENNPIANASFNKNTLKTRLNLAKETYITAIDNIKKNAYRELKGVIDEHFSEEYVNTLFTDYLDDANSQPDIDITGSTCSYEEKINFKKYIRLCESIYTDFSTRDLHNSQHLAGVAEKLDRVINHYQEINGIYENLEAVKNQLNYLARREIVIEEKDHPWECKKQVLAIDRKKCESHIIDNIKSLVNDINNFLKLLNREDEYINEDECIMGDKISVVSLPAKLDVIKRDIDEEYNWYFTQESISPETWISEMDDKLSLDRIPMFKNKHLSVKGVIGFSFLYQAGLIGNNNIRLMDIGFRNRTTYGGLWNTLATRGMKFKGNPLTWFENLGEVDYVAYIERDTSPARKDKIFIVYSGSNSDTDWGNNLTIGLNSYLGLAVHQGIGWLSEESSKKHQPALIQKIQTYYRGNKKPLKLEIITTGHSLGGALAELTAYRYKTQFINEFNDITQTQNIKVKTYTFGSPAIVDEVSKIKIEEALGKENIFRIWTFGDPVVDWSARKRLPNDRPYPFRGLLFDDTTHIGRNVVLYNMYNQNFGLLDWWRKHGTERYKSYLEDLDKPFLIPQISNFLEILNNYIRVKRLPAYKKHKKMVLEITKQLVTDSLPQPLLLDRDLAARIIRYTPTTIKLTPPSSVEEALQAVHSPRYAASISPRFTVEESGNLYSYDTNASNSYSTNEKAVRVKRTSNLLYNRHEITATFRLEGQVIDFPINKDTPCTIQAVKQFLNDKGLYLADEDIQPFSCGAFLAKHIFVSQYVTFPSYYYGVAGRRDVHLDTLTKIYQGCVDEKVCTPQYLMQTGRQREPLQQALGILTQVGLGEAFKQKQLHFTRYDAQDRLRRDIRHGKELVTEPRPALRFDRNLLARLIQPLDITQVNEDIFNNERQILYNQLCTATSYADHWNRLMSFIDINEFRNLILHQARNQGQEFRTHAFQNFQRNLMHLLTFANPNYNCLPSCLNRRPTLHHQNLIYDLNRLRREVIGEATLAS